MKPGPPRAMEVVVGLLIPPASREHVLGDLYERYTCPQQYISDAVWAVPCVIMSRIRRTTDLQLLLMEAFALYLSFLGSAWKLEGVAFLHQQWSLLRLAIPTVAGLIALILGDAYASPGKRSPLNPLLDATLAIAFALSSQAVLWAVSRGLLLPSWIVIFGGGMSLLAVATLRMLFPPSDDRPRGAT